MEWMCGSGHVLGAITNNEILMMNLADGRQMTWDYLEVGWVGMQQNLMLL